MARIPDDVIKEINEINVLDYLLMTEPESIRKVNNDRFTLKDHDSMSISPSKNAFNWFSQGIGGKGALQYLTKVKGLHFREAVKELADFKNINIDNYEYQKIKSARKQIKKEEKKMGLPSKSFSSESLKNYLMDRFISKEVVDYCLRNEYVYQSFPRNNIVFLGKDEDGKVRFAELRGTYGDFKGHAKGSDKAVGFSINNEKSNKLIVFEGAVDLLSYMTILEKQSNEWYQYLPNMLSVGGVSKGENLPSALERYLEKNTNVEKIDIIFDKDDVGRTSARTCVNILESDYDIRSCNVMYGKDLNDTLKVKNILKIKLEDDNSIKHGGISFEGETLGVFMAETWLDPELILTNPELINEELNKNGIKKLEIFGDSQEKGNLFLEEFRGEGERE